jgi:NAD-dependent histone deacetylase SIR2
LSPRIFYSIAKDILPTTKTFSPTHAFIALLQTKGKLLTQYTQNIDNLEMLAGIHPDKLIQCHGSFATASCVKCKHQVPGETIFPELKRGMVAKCDNCLKLLAETSASNKNRKRANNSDTWKKRKRVKNSGEHKKKRYSEDSSAEEEEVNFREAGVMKVIHNPPPPTTVRKLKIANSPISPSLENSFRIPSTSASLTTIATRQISSSASAPALRSLRCRRS